MTRKENLLLYTTPEYDCSYIEGRKARTLFLDPKEEVDPNLFNNLAHLGFRRSGKHIYRPHCSVCDRCISIRVVAGKLRFSRNQKRCLSINKDLKLTTHPAKYNRERYQLYADYITERHSDGDMFPPTVEQFTSFLIESPVESFFCEYRDETGELLAVCTIDPLGDGYALVYSFFRASNKYRKRSLGTFIILSMIKKCQEMKLPYLYLGYWVPECKKMNYKTRFGPSEILINQRWCDLEKISFE